MQERIVKIVMSNVKPVDVWHGSLSADQPRLSNELF